MPNLDRAKELDELAISFGEGAKIFADYMKKKMNGEIEDNSNDNNNFNSEELYDAYLNIIVPWLQNMQDD